VLRGRVNFSQAAREVVRRGRVAVSRRRERAMLDAFASQPAQLRPDFQSLSAGDLLKHFRERSAPSFFSGFESAEATAAQQRSLFPDETERQIEAAHLLTNEHRWPLLGFGDKEFGRHPPHAGSPRVSPAQIDWHRDPLSGRIWPLDYHADIPLWHNDGSDIRVLWEFNRLGHLITLGRAYALTNDEDFAVEFFAQAESWREQNPVGRGANWACAMEVSLRAMNLLAAFSLFRNSPSLNEARLQMLLRMFDQHGAHIRRNLEFSYVATSNHYLSDVVGLLWLGIMLPELAQAAGWREWALREMLREMDKQILPDGADYEGSTAYHCFVLELLLYSFVLCRANQIRIEDKYWRKLAAMFVYLRGVLRPDGFLPLIGDTDGGQVLPIVSRAANDRGYLLAVGAAFLKEVRFKTSQSAAPPELLWLLGADGLRDYEQLTSLTQANSGTASAASLPSHAFPDAGTYVLRHEDLFLLFNANGARSNRPASHLHNDVLSFEVFAGGRAFIVDPGTYVYTADLRERHRFRSTCYHSTIEIDDQEQRTIQPDYPFVSGDEATARVVLWESTADYDRVVAEHSGYERLAQPATHERAITFNKTDRWWLIEDEIAGKGEHKVAARFHFDAGLEVKPFNRNGVSACDPASGACLLVCALDLDLPAEVQTQFISTQYGSKLESLSACWTTTTSALGKFRKLRWAIIPVRGGEDAQERLGVVQSPKSKVRGPKPNVRLPTKIVSRLSVFSLAVSVIVSANCFDFELTSDI
jgi:hypothetical protein